MIKWILLSLGFMVTTENDSRTENYDSTRTIFSNITFDSYQYQTTSQSLGYSDYESEDYHA